MHDSINTGLKAGVNENIDPRVDMPHVTGRYVMGRLGRSDPGSKETDFLRTGLLVPDSAAKDEQRSKKQRATDRDGAAVKLHGLVLS